MLRKRDMKLQEKNQKVLIEHNIYVGKFLIGMENYILIFLMDFLIIASIAYVFKLNVQALF